MPEVSILMPVFNTASFLPEALESMLGQSFSDFEFLALDDGSTDGSGAILRRYARRDGRLHPILRGNRGLVETRNELLHAASGRYVAWMDSDDRAAPERLDRQLARFEVEPELVCLGAWWMLTDPMGLPIRVHRFPAAHEEIVRAMEEEIAIGFGASMMKREVALAVGGFRHPFVISEDFDLCLRLSEVGRMANVPEVLLYYRQHMTSTVNAGRPRSYAYSRLARELARERRLYGQDRLQRGEPVELRFDDEPPAVNQMKTHARWAWWALGEGHLRTARKYAWRTVVGAPWSKDAWRLAFCALRGY